MFGMILKIQAFIDKLKKKKGMWFSILTASSIIGIIGTMYYLNTMTQRMTKNLYESTNASYFYDLDMSVQETTQKLLSSASIAAQSGQIQAAADPARLKALAEAVKGESSAEIVVDFYTNTFARVASSMDSLNPIKATYESKTLQKALATQKPASGVEYQDGRVYIKAAYPSAGGILEFKQNIDFLYDAYLQDGKIFQVLLDRELLDMKRVVEFKNQPVGKNFISVQAVTDSEFLQKSAELDFAKIVEEKYILEDDYFVLAKPILNADGKRIGVYVIAERYMENNSLPKMVKSMSTGLTTAALGLVVALLALMV